MRMNKFQQASIFAGLLAATITLNAFAFELEQVQNGDKPFQSEFNTLDKNGSESLSWAELKADQRSKEADFKTFDQNHNGLLSYEEFAEMRNQTGQKAIKTAMSDSWITTKAKAMLLEEASLRAFKISVETHKGEVILSGFVDDAQLKAKAETIVAAIDGVRSVKNAIEVKS